LCNKYFGKQKKMSEEKTEQLILEVEKKNKTIFFDKFRHDYR